MNGTLIGFAMGLIIAIVAAIFGKRLGEKQAVVSKRDVMDGMVTRIAQGRQYTATHRETLHAAKVTSDEVSQQIKEAPNEEIVRMFIDAFDKPASERGQRR